MPHSLKSVGDIRFGGTSRGGDVNNCVLIVASVVVVLRVRGLVVVVVVVIVDVVKGVVSSLVITNGVVFVVKSGPGNVLTGTGYLLKTSSKLLLLFWLSIGKVGVTKLDGS